METKSNPLVSIVLPVYNVDRYLRRCLESLINQTYQAIEIVLIDDGSTDNSGIICDEYAAIDKRISVLHDTNKGVVAARITGLQMSKGDLICFVDSDDFVSPNYIEVLHNSFQQYQVDIVACLYNVIIDGESYPNYRSVQGVFNKEGIRKILSTNLLYDKKTKTSGFPLMLWGKLYKKGILLNALKESIGFWLAEDEVSMLSMLYSVNSICILPDNLYNYVHHDSQVTRKYRDDQWDAYHKLWTKLMDIDKENLLKEQYPYRIWYYSYAFYTQFSMFNSSLRSFMSKTKHIFDSDLVRNTVFATKVVSLSDSKTEYILYYILKYRFYLLSYLLLSLRKIYKRGI